jgi:hypothetical protein
MEWMFDNHFHGSAFLRGVKSSYFIDKLTVNLNTVNLTGTKQDMKNGGNGLPFDWFSFVVKQAEDNEKILFELIKDRIDRHH